MNLNVQEYLLLFTALSALLIWFLNIRPLENLLGEKRCAAASKWVLILLSYAFIGYIDLRIAVMMAALTMFVFAATLRRVKLRSSSAVKKIGIAAAVLLLCIFKYLNFFIDSFCRAFSLGSRAPIVLFVPIGISYFTFSIISYICDSYSDKPDESESFTDTALFVVFFLKFISGPIVRYRDFLKEAGRKRSITAANFQMGIQMMIFGFFKKAVIADHLGIFTDSVFKTPAAFDTGTVWLGVISFTIQLYFDFSGYSDIVLGGARILGFRFAPNFDIPFAACSIQDFWRRWHISLSTWFKDYVYIPLGGNRKGRVRTGINKIVVFLLTGIWHGAGMTFIVWGMIHGIFILLETYKVIQPDRWRIKPLKYIYTLSVVVIAFMFFRADSMADAWLILKRMFVPSVGVSHHYTWTFTAMILAAGAILYAWCAARREKTADKRLHFVYPLCDLGTFRGLVSFFTFVGLTFLLAYFGATGFVYANF